MCVCPCCPCSGLVSSTLLILSPRWQTAPSTLLLQISASSHPVQPYPKVGHVLWPFWVIFFQKSKRGYLSPEGVSSLCVCVCVCSLNSWKHKPVCVCQVCKLAHKKDWKQNTQHSIFFLLVSPRLQNSVSRFEVDTQQSRRICVCRLRGWGLLFWWFIHTVASDKEQLSCDTPLIVLPNFCGAAVISEMWIWSFFMLLFLQFKVPPATSAIITNGEFGWKAFLQIGLLIPFRFNT